jgi:hypothetical protein
MSERGTLVFGAGQGFAYAVSALGGLVWRVKLPAPATEAVVLHKNGFVFMGTQRGVATWQTPARQQLWPSPPVEQFLLGEGVPGTPPIWLASGRAFSSHGPMDLGDGLRFGRQLAEGGQLLSTRSELRWLKPTGAVERSVPLVAEPSAPPLVGPLGEIWIPTVEGTLLGIEPNGVVARPVARVGFSPVSALVPEGDDQIVAATGEGNVCAVSRMRLGSSP